MYTHLYMHTLLYVITYIDLVKHVHIDCKHLCMPTRIHVSMSAVLACMCWGKGPRSTLNMQYVHLHAYMLWTHSMYMYVCMYVHTYIRICMYVSKYI
jgi:hypothetical protein